MRCSPLYEAAALYLISLAVVSCGSAPTDTAVAGVPSATRKPIESPTGISPIAFILPRPDCA